ncbi:MAG TPA: DUF4870 domain-containing protein [Bacteroidales bacterium]|nr:DUF4870 domain-containing protein [Bacteroidales bacterium]
MIARALEVDYNIFVGNEPDDEFVTQKIDSINWLGLLHFSGIIPLIFPTVLIWNYKKNKVKGISEHYRDVISFQLQIWIGILAGLWIYWKAGQPIPLILVFFVNGLFMIINTIKVFSGQSYRHFSFFKPGTKNDETK